MSSWFTDFHREIISEMGELGVLGPTIKGKGKGIKSKVFCNTEWFELRGIFHHSLVTFGSCSLLQVMAVQALVTSHMV